jgi:type VI secretion system secreted protein Hcp
MNIRYSILTFVTTVTCLGFAAEALAEPDAFMRIKSKAGGDIKGGATQKGREGMIVVDGIDHNVVVPVDVSSGLASGRRVHKPIVITKAVDKSSPALHQAIAQNEILSEVTIQFFEVGKDGVERNHYTIVLKNARITGLRHVMLDNNKPDSARLPAYEELSLVYDTITWTWNDGGITATDSATATRQ